jgi:hypothetical protein
MTEEEDLRTYLEGLLADSNGHKDHTEGHRHLLVDWAAFWEVDTNDAQWLAEPYLAIGRSHALYATGGTGKSMFALWAAVHLATTGVDVLYLDYEMTVDDLSDRLTAMDCGPETDLSHLHYALLPSIAPLDTAEGGKVVVELAAEVGAQLVIIDTYARAVTGKENEADTVRAWYRWTGLHLKYAGRAFLRIDHAGKDLDRGQRGSSAKNDDVDVVWYMARGEGGDHFTLRATKRRMGWVPNEVGLVRHDDPLRFEVSTAYAYPAGTDVVVALLAGLGVPADASNRQAKAAVREAGRKVSNRLIQAAVKYRQVHALIFDAEPVDNDEEPVDGDAESVPQYSPVHLFPEGTGYAPVHPEPAPGNPSPTASAPYPVPSGTRGEPKGGSTGDDSLRYTPQAGPDDPQNEPF